MLPANVPASRGVLAANMETALNALWDAAPGPADRIAVIGAGVVGCLCAWLAGKLPGATVTIHGHAEYGQTLSRGDGMFDLAVNGGGYLTVVFAKDGQIFSYAVRGPERVAPQASAPAAGSRTSQSPGALSTLIKAWGTNGAAVWSPNGSRIAFVSNRVDHSFVGVYDVKTRDVTFLSPSVDHDTSPTWSPDGKQIAFIRRPGTPFGQQAHQGVGGIGNPDGPNL